MSSEVKNESLVLEIVLMTNYKQEIYYAEELLSYKELKRKIEIYIDYYNNERIKEKLAGLSPVEYRTQISQIAA